jgi:Disulphide bond corrector protein DsbC
MRGFFAILAVALLGIPAFGQSSEGPQQSTSKVAAVEYLYPEQVTLAAGKSSPVSLHFRIEPGFHINSHTPKDEFLVPTVLSIPEDAGVKLEHAAYPPGADFVLPADPDTKLSVYTGEFAIETKLTAEPGDHLVKAKLRYQACDKTACMPPKTIVVPIDVVGK